MSDDAASGSAMGPALFIGLSLFVAVTQGTPEVNSDPQATHEANLTASPEALEAQVPAPLVRPALLSLATLRPDAQRAAPASADPVARADRASWARPALPAPALASAPRAGTGLAAAPARADLPANPAAPRQASIPQAEAQAQADDAGSPRPTLPAPRLFAQGAQAAPAPGTLPRPSPAPARTQRPGPAPAASAGIALDARPGPERPDVAVAVARSDFAPPVTGARPRGPGLPKAEAPVTPRPAPRPAAHDPNPDDAAPTRPAAPLRWLSGDRVYLRTGPGTGFADQGLYAKGTPLRVHGRFGNWVRAEILDQGTPRHGWIWHSYAGEQPPG